MFARRGYYRRQPRQSEPDGSDDVHSQVSDGAEGSRRYRSASPPLAGVPAMEYRTAILQKPAACQRRYHPGRMYAATARGVRAGRNVQRRVLHVCGRHRPELQGSQGWIQTVFYSGCRDYTLRRREQFATNRQPMGDEDAAPCHESVLRQDAAPWVCRLLQGRHGGLRAGTAVGHRGCQVVWECAVGPGKLAPRQGEVERDLTVGRRAGW